MAAPSSKEPEVKLDPIALRQLGELYGERLEQDMGMLHARFVAFISEAQLPLSHVCLVLTLLLAEVTELAKQKYLG